MVMEKQQVLMRLGHPSMGADCKLQNMNALSRSSRAWYDKHMCVRCKAMNT